MLVACFLSFVLIGTAVLFGVAGFYPALLPSSLAPEFNLTIMSAASSPLSLKIMLVVALIVVPIVVLYQIWVYYIFRRKPKEMGGPRRASVKEAGRIY